uniref:AAA family ATPase n=1 Tax=Clostridium fessum TaxID=2126740 RepID=UPI003AAACF67
MLYHLRVKNLALIDSAEVEFGDGLNILTGETGAGKSIIIGSVQIALGGKAPKEMIRRGCDSAYIELVFSIDDERKREQLKEHDVYPDEEGILIISKKITPTRSISRINDETVTAARLREITGLLIDLHGQHEHQSLLYPDKQMEILDEYSEAESGEKKEAVKMLYGAYRQIRKELEGYQLDEEQRRREISFLEYEIQEIQNAELK